MAPKSLSVCQTAPKAAVLDRKLTFYPKQVRQLVAQLAPPYCRDAAACFCDFSQFTHSLALETSSIFQRLLLVYQHSNSHLRFVVLLSLAIDCSIASQRVRYFSTSEARCCVLPECDDSKAAHRLWSTATEKIIPASHYCLLQTFASKRVAHRRASCQSAFVHLPADLHLSCRLARLARQSCKTCWVLSSARYIFTGLRCFA